MMTFREPESCFSREFTLIIRAIKRQFGCCSHQTIVYRQPTLQEKSIMEKFVYQICVAALSLFRLAQATVLFSDPRDRIVEVNQWAQFNCTVRCDYSVGWYTAGCPNAIRRNNTVPGLLIKRLRPSSCTESNKRTHFIEVLATEAFNKSTFYCAAYERRPKENSCSCGTGGRCYSRPAFLTVRTAPTLSPPSQATGTLEITPSLRSSTSSTSQDPTSSSSEMKPSSHSSPSSTSPGPTSSSPEKKSSTQAAAQS